MFDPISPRDSEPASASAGRKLFRRESGIGTRLALVGLLVAGLALFVGGGWVLVRASRPRADRVLMLTDLDPLRAMLARRIASEARQRGLEVELSSKSYGSLDAIDMVNQPNPVGLVLVPGGFSRGEYPNVRQVTSLVSEPLHLFVRSELASGGLASLRGKRVNLGPESMAAHFLARDALSFAGLLHPKDAPKGDYLPETLTPIDVEQALTRIEHLPKAEQAQAIRALPDAFCILSALPSLVARHLVHVTGYQLVPLPFASAYCLDRLGTDVVSGVRINRASIQPTEIPAYTYSTDPAIPPTSCTTVSTRLQLLVYAPVESTVVKKLLESVFDSPIATLIQPPPLRDQSTEFAFHAGAEQYLRRNDPWLTPDQAAQVGKLFGGFGALLSGVFALLGFLKVLKLRRFEAYYHEIGQIERLALGREVEPGMPTNLLLKRTYLEDRLLEVKTRAIRDFADGGLKGEGLIAGIIALINDTRGTIERLVPDPE